MFVKKVNVIGVERTDKNDRQGRVYSRYYATAPIAPEKGDGESVFTFTSTVPYLIGDEVSIVFSYRKDRNGNTFSSWEPVDPADFS